MKRGLLSYSFLLFSFFANSQDCVNSGDAFSGVSGWGACTNMASSASSTKIFTTTAITAGDRYFRFYGDGTPCGEYGPSGGSDVQMNIGVVENLTCGSSKAYYINTMNTSNNYIFKTGGVGTSNSDEGKAIVFEVQGTIQTVTAVSSTTSVGSTQSYTVTATLSNTLSTGQGIYLRYTSDNFATSTVAAMSVSGTSATATIPALNASGTVKYYVFTSGNGLTIASANADLFTINLNNNGGSNYSYSSIVLDAALLNISAVKTASSTELTWQTASEKNNAQFNIQRSPNNQTWQTIGSVKATNNPSGAKYNFVDEAPLSHINYYRLQMVDNDGKMTYSKVVAVSAEDGKKTLAVYPNPVKSELNLVTDGNTEGVSIFDMTGRAVRQYNDNRTKVNVSDLPNGVYFLRLLDKNGLASAPVRFVKQ